MIYIGLKPRDKTRNHIGFMSLDDCSYYLERLNEIKLLYSKQYLLDQFYYTAPVVGKVELDIKEYQWV